MWKDKKIERILGINSNIKDGLKDEELEIKLIEEVNSFLEKHGEKYKKLCKVVMNPKNYEYDCRVAIFMMLGVKYAPIHSSWEKVTICPFEVKEIKNFKKITSWCDDFQEVIMLKNFNDFFNLKKSENGRLDRFGYHRLLDMQQSLIKRIERDCNRENELKEKKYELLVKKINELLEKKPLLTMEQITELMKDKVLLSAEDKEELDMLQRATESRKENWFLADIVLGISFSFTLYHGIKMVSQYIDVDFDIFVKLIKQLSLLKCFQLRNVIADIVFQMLVANINADYVVRRKKEKITVDADIIKKITYDVTELIKIVNQYYINILTLKWNVESRNNKMNDKVYRQDYMNHEVNSIGTYIEDGNANTHLVEKNINIINGIYKEELEEDLKNLHDVKYNYSDDQELLYIEGFPILNIGDMSKEKKKEKIVKEEDEKLKDAEIKMKITTERKKIVSNASVLFTFIHWKVMKMYVVTM